MVVVRLVAAVDVAVGVEGVEVDGVEGVEGMEEVEGLEGVAIFNRSRAG
jgi:hypothetical protein